MRKLKIDCVYLKVPLEFFSLKVPFAGLCVSSLRCCCITVLRRTRETLRRVLGTLLIAPSHQGLDVSPPRLFHSVRDVSPPGTTVEKFPQADSLTDVHLSGFLSYPGYYPIAENRYVLYFV